LLRIITKNQMFFIGKISDLLEVLVDLGKQYTTVEAAIQDQLSMK